MNGIKISGLGKAVPSYELTNDAISQMVDTSDEWIKSRTGISSRHIGVEETTSTLAIKAAQEALDNSQIVPDEIDLVIVATVSADNAMPSTACIVAGELGINNATCFDVSAACSGFIYATEIATNMIKAGNYENALVIGAETMSRLLDWTDRSTCILFGDGAGAVVYSKSNENKIIDIQTLSNGKENNLIQSPHLYSESNFNHVEVKKNYIEMNGQAVYRFATTQVPKSIEELLNRNELSASDVDWFIIHQANARIITSIAKHLKVNESLFFQNLSTHGNTSGASIPMALYDAQSKLKAGDKIILSGFGAGLTWGSILIEW